MRGHGFAATAQAWQELPNERRGQRQRLVPGAGAAGLRRQSFVHLFPVPERTRTSRPNARFRSQPPRPRARPSLQAKMRNLASMPSRVAIV